MKTISKNLLIFFVISVLNSILLTNAFGECEYQTDGKEPVIKALRKIYVSKTRKYAYQSGKKLKNKKTNPNKPVCFMSNYNIKSKKISSKPVNIKEDVELILVAECIEKNQNDGNDMLILMFKPKDPLMHEQGLVMNCFTHRERSFGRGTYFTGSPTKNQVKEVFKTYFDMSQL
ncbi:hypothetical protein N9N67_10175 [Bacteriovoracaceae bacterium]|nr:hypothetical protein [Bacteriovoracaceae bacterium]